LVKLWHAVKPTKAQANKTHLPRVKAVPDVFLMFEYICIVSRIL
jgi:hypothetical protein